jgi:hypothetical protein
MRLRNGVEEWGRGIEVEIEKKRERPCPHPVFPHPPNLRVKVFIVL